MSQRRTEEEMKILDDKIRPMRMAGKKNKEICEVLGISYTELSASLRRLGIYERTIKSEYTENSGVETMTVNSLMEAKFKRSENAKIKVYVDKREGKKYSDVSEFYGL